MNVNVLGQNLSSITHDPFVIHKRIVGSNSTEAAGTLVDTEAVAVVEVVVMTQLTQP